MIELVKILSVLPSGPSRLRLRFSDGTSGEHDFAPMLAEGGEMVEPLRDPAMFARAFVQMGTVSWPNGFDLDSIALRREMGAAGELDRPAA
ncbi:uncharacterized protein DUF2442 [Stella humosa]|uniref:Uncharacterized protein DUF2442 n=1 Tax=Stella humosa TaxID=94 RepID=A0A3N1MLW3_9PROT|nr:DUF2442 domain-containing protein [Stella humosa]ROQ03360.1 uncharacterized protein DUF2442 [Stella humosa]BBK29647.1 hypothetical protein STHU_02810 [Stella humosa]